MLGRLFRGRVRRTVLTVATAVATVAGAGIAVTALPASGDVTAAPFKVLAFYSGTFDAAHIDFDKEAKTWFPQTAAANGFTFEATTDWSRLNIDQPRPSTRW